MNYLTGSNRSYASYMIPSLAKQGFKNLKKTKALAGKLVKDTVVSNDVHHDSSLNLDGHCKEADLLFANVLIHSLNYSDNDNGYYFRRGIWIAVDDEPLGFMKLKGERTFLAATSVRNGRTYPLIKGGIYTLDYDLSRDLSKKYKPDEIVKVEYLDVRFNRLLNLQNIKNEYGFIPNIEMALSFEFQRIKAKIHTAKCLGPLVQTFNPNPDLFRHEVDPDLEEFLESFVA